MTIKIQELPESERPYEKLELYGAKALSNAELLAIIIKTGTKELTSVDIAKQILNINQNENRGDLNFLRDLSIEELMQIKGIGRVKAVQIKAMCEITSRMNKPSNYRKITITKPKDVADLLMSDLQFEKNEIVKLIILNNKNTILKIIDVSRGRGNSALIDIKFILSETIKMGAPQIILVHNHPSGDATPSKKDIETTEKVKSAAELLGVRLLDHIVIGNMCYRSIISD
ncbi:MAG: DNA repair protein RadC [Clostridia bacterium]|nr:DNA repair protein RadC [Clostridia bacterium]